MARARARKGRVQSELITPQSNMQFRGRELHALKLGPQSRSRSRGVFHIRLSRSAYSEILCECRQQSRLVQCWTSFQGFSTWTRCGTKKESIFRMRRRSCRPYVVAWASDCPHLVTLPTEQQRNLDALQSLSVVQLGYVKEE